MVNEAIGAGQEGLRKETRNRLPIRGRNAGIQSAPNRLEGDKSKSCRVTWVKVVGVKTKGIGLSRMFFNKAT